MRDRYLDSALTPTSPLADIENDLSDLLSSARMAKEIIVLVPALLRGHEMFILEPGFRADMVLTAVGKPVPFINPSSPTRDPGGPHDT